VTGGAGCEARRGARSAGLVGGTGCSGVLNAARGVRERGTSRPACVGGFSSIRRSLVGAAPFHLLCNGAFRRFVRWARSTRTLRLPVPASGGALTAPARAGRTPGSALVNPAEVVSRQPLCPATGRSGILDHRWSGEAAKETSPSPVYGAALLMRLGFYSPSRVRIPESPRVKPVCKLAEHERP
jgi:hypothetical protein